MDPRAGSGRSTDSRPLQNQETVSFSPPSASASFRGAQGNQLTIFVPSPFTITQVVPHFATSPVTQHIIIIVVTIASDARRKSIANSTTAGSATVPTSVAGVVAVSELRAFLVVL